MRILELFSGTESFSKVARELGHETFTIDNDPQFNPDLCIDIMDLDFYTLMQKAFTKGFDDFDIVWASPPCQRFSVASISKNWNKDGTPKNEETKKAVKLIKKTFDLIDKINPDFFFLENPRGMLRKIAWMKDDLRKTVTYCQYGDTRMKPTDIWTDLDWEGKSCKNGDSCHVSAPRGSRTGTQGIKSARDRSVIPPKLCLEILGEVM